MSTSYEHPVVSEISYASTEHQAPSHGVIEDDVVLNDSGLQSFLSQAEQALHEKSSATTEGLKTSKNELERKISVLATVLATSNRELRNLTAELAELEYNTSAQKETLQKLSDRVLQVTEDMKQLGDDELILADEATEEIRRYLVSLGIKDPNAMIAGFTRLDDQKNYLLDENQALSEGIQGLKNDRFDLKEKLRKVELHELELPASRLYAINAALPAIDLELERLNQEVNLNNERIAAYDLYHEKLAALQIINERAGEVFLQHEALSAELQDLYRQISELTGLPLYAEPAQIVETSVNNPEATYINQPTMHPHTAEVYSPHIPGVALYNAGHKQA